MSLHQCTYPELFNLRTAVPLSNFGSLSAAVKFHFSLFMNNPVKSGKWHPGKPGFLTINRK
jgi:hypothetical protein